MKTKSDSYIYYYEKNEMPWKGVKPADFIADFLNGAPFPIMSINPDTSIEFVNIKLEQMTGFPAPEIIGTKPPYPWWRQEALKETAASFYNIIDNGGGTQEQPIRTKDGKLLIVRINIVPKRKNNGEIAYFMSDWLDVTAKKEAEEALKKAHEELELRVEERTNDLMKLNIKLHQQIAKRKRIERELLNSREQLRSLSSHLQCIRENERTFIAREIHDELGQALTALKLDSSWLCSHLAEGQEYLRKKINSMLEIIDSAIKQVKRLSSELRPRILDDLGIVDAIDWQASNFQETTGIKCDVHYVETREISLERDKATAIFRIFQEALTNIARHANASMVNVQLERKNNKIMLKVIDNGVGITKEQISALNSLGLLGMSERARSLGGKLRIKGVKGRGTIVTVSIPLHTKGKTL